MRIKREWMLVAAVALLLGGCLSTQEKPDEIEKQYWPALPERPRFVHEFTLRNAGDIQVPTEEQRLQNLLAGEQLVGQALLKPFAIVARGGRLYITDTKMDQVHVFDVPRRKYFRMGYRFEGQLTEPRGIAVDDAGLIYVVDAAEKAKRVVVFDSIGLYQRSISLKEMVRPTGITVSPDGSRIYVVDTGTLDSDKHQVVVFDPEGEVVETIGQRGHGEEDLNLPVDVELAPDGRLFVLDAGNFRVQIYRGTEWVGSWSKVGRNLGDLARPRSIAMDNAGRVYISDASFANIQIFTDDGKLLLPLGKRGVDDENGVLTLISGIDVDETGRIYVVDQRHNKVEIYRPVGRTEAEMLQANYED